MYLKTSKKYKGCIRNICLHINSLNAKVPSYRNQSTDLQTKSTDLFLHDGV